MIYIRNLLFQERFHSRWLVLLIDLMIVFISLCLAISLKNKLDLKQDNIYYLVFYCGSAIFTFLIMRIHARIIRYSNTKDMLRIFVAVLVSNVAFMLLCNILFEPYLRISLAGLGDILLINFFISSSLLMGMRIVIKDLFVYLEEPAVTVNRESVLIFGSGTSSILIKKAVE